MKIVKLGRGQGKTTELLVWLLEGHAEGIDRVLIVTTQQARSAVVKKLRGLYNENGQPKYINNAANRIYTVEGVKRIQPTYFNNCEIGIDDVDLVLTWLLGINRSPSIIAVNEHDPSTDPPETIVTVGKKYEEMPKNEISFR